MASTDPGASRPSLIRRLAAVFYDGLLLIALWMAASALWLGVVGDGSAVASGDAAFRLYLLAIAWVFLVGCWLRGGRTLGMQAWRLRLTAADGGPLTLRRANARFFAALVSWLPAGAGFLWALVDREGLTWHDRLSGTRVVLEPRPRRR